MHSYWCIIPLLHLSIRVNSSESTSDPVVRLPELILSTVSKIHLANGISCFHVLSRFNINAGVYLSSENAQLWSVHCILERFFLMLIQQKPTLKHPVRQALKWLNILIYTTVHKPLNVVSIINYYNYIACRYRDHVMDTTNICTKSLLQICWRNLVLPIVALLRETITYSTRSWPLLMLNTTVSS